MQESFERKTTLFRSGLFGEIENNETIESINMPDSITAIGISAFAGCASLKSINIPKKITSINYYVFGGCKSLKSIENPDSVTEIGSYAFKGCANLEILIPRCICRKKSF